MLKFVLVTAIFFCLTDTARADMSAAHLKQYCEDKNSPAQLACVGYIQGVLDTLSFTEDISRQTPLGAGAITCMPDAAPENEKLIQGIVERYLDEHPEELNYSAISEVEAALMEAYPCPAKSN